KHTFSPTNISWGLEDRSALVRVKGGEPESTHTENRGPTALSNPYLVGAAVLSAGLAGVWEGRAPPPPPAGGPARGGSVPRAASRFAARGARRAGRRAGHEGVLRGRVPEGLRCHARPRARPVHGLGERLGTPGIPRAVLRRSFTWRERVATS